MCRRLRRSGEDGAEDDTSDDGVERVVRADCSRDDRCDPTGPPEVSDAEVLPPDCVCVVRDRFSCRTIIGSLFDDECCMRIVNVAEERKGTLYGTVRVFASCAYTSPHPSLTAQREDMNCML